MRVGVRLRVGVRVRLRVGVRLRLSVGLPLYLKLRLGVLAEASVRSALMVSSKSLARSSALRTKVSAVSSWLGSRLGARG